MLRFNIFFLILFVAISAIARDPFALQLNDQGEQTAVIPLHYANAKTLANIINTDSLHAHSDAGSVIPIPEQNELLVRDYPPEENRIIALIHQLDKRQLEIFIRAKIIILDTQYQKALGALINSQSSTSATNQYNGTTKQNGKIFNLPLVKFSNHQLLNVEIHALSEEGHAKIIASPELVTLNHQSASIEAGEEVPYQSATNNGATSVAFKKAVLRLKITPAVLPHHLILLNIEVNQDKVSTLTVQGVPAIRTQKIHTQILAKNKQTIILGGIFENSQSKEHKGVAGLEAIPIFGGLFRHHQRSSSQHELMILLTPTIK